MIKLIDSNHSLYDSNSNKLAPVQMENNLFFELPVALAGSYGNVNVSEDCQF